MPRRSTSSSWWQQSPGLGSVPTAWPEAVAARMTARSEAHHWLTTRSSGPLARIRSPRPLNADVRRMVEGSMAGQAALVGGVPRTR